MTAQRPRGTEPWEPASRHPTPSHWIDASPKDLPPTIASDTLALLREPDGRPVCVVLTTSEVDVGDMADLCSPGPMSCHRPGVVILDRASGPRPESAVAPDARPSMTVVVPTTGNVPGLRRMLASLTEQEPWIDEVVIVPNGCDPAPVSALATEVLGERIGADVRVIASSPGLSRARNTGLALATSELCAFIDDDVVLDPGWGRAAAAAAVRHPGATFFGGLVVGLDPSHEAQFWFDAVGGFRKGLDEVVHDGPSMSRLTALLRAGTMGTGANGFGRTESLRALGGYCEALGAGTKGVGGEDLNLILDILDGGGSTVYVADMVVAHPAPADWLALEDQALRYGIGLTSMATHRLLTGRLRMRDVLVGAPQALRVVRGRSGYAGGAGPEFPRRLKVLEMRGLAIGPLAYLRTPRLARRNTAVPAVG